MKTKSLFYKTTAWLLILVTVLSLMPLTIVFAASPAKEYTYKITVKNSNVKNAGTDGDVYCVVKTHSSGNIAKKIDSKANDFEKNDCRTYNVTLEVQPWEIKEVGLKNTGKDGMHIAYFKFRLPNGTWLHQDVNAWFEKQGNKVYERTYSVWSQVDRRISSRGNFDSNFSGTKYFDTNTTSASDIVMEWDGKVSDQYFSNYNFFGYYGAVGITFSPKATSYGYSGISNIDSMESNGLVKVDTKDGFNNKLTIYTQKLLNYMATNNIYKFELKSEIDYMSQSDEYTSFSKTYTIYRTGFKLENASAITSAYTPERDNFIYNSNEAYKTFEVKIPVKDMNNYNAATIASELVKNIKSGTSPAKVYYDQLTTNGYITPKAVYSSGSNIYLKCDVPKGYANNNPLGPIGLTVVIDNAKAAYNSKTYTLDEKNARYEYYISTHRVDTKGLTHTLKDEEQNVINQTKGFDTYAREHKFMLEVDAGQDIYMDNSNGGRTSGYFSYRLFSSDEKSEIALQKHNGLAATSYVPHAGNSLYRIAPVEKVEGEYKLKISSRDFANNLETTTIPVKLDGIAPRATYTVKEVAPVDGSKRNEYSFKIDDTSGTGKLYYAFVRDGYSVPDTTVTKPDSSGPQETIYEKWGFINQVNSQAQTIVLEIAEDDYFKGKLYWYTVDDAGNNSRDEKNSGTDKNGFYYKDIMLSNVKADCEIILDDVTPGKPEYDIKFETSSLNKVEYSWIGKGITTQTTVYSSSSNPGNATQKNGSGNTVTLNGEYTLKYVVITPDGARTTYTRDFVFDNISPEITIGTTEETVGPTKRISIYAKDISNIETIKYQLYTAGGEAVVLEMSVPVYMIPESKVPDEIKELELPDGRLDNSGNETVQAFAESVVNNATNYTNTVSFITDSLGEKQVYFADECGRVYKQTIKIADLAEKESDTESDGLTGYVSFGNKPPVNVKFYQAIADIVR